MALGSIASFSTQGLAQGPVPNLVTMVPGSTHNAELAVAPGMRELPMRPAQGPGARLFLSGSPGCGRGAGRAAAGAPAAAAAAAARRAARPSKLLSRGGGAGASSSSSSSRRCPNQHSPGEEEEEEEERRGAGKGRVNFAESPAAPPASAESSGSACEDDLEAGGRVAGSLLPLLRVHPERKGDEARLAGPGRVCSAAAAPAPGTAPPLLRVSAATCLPAGPPAFPKLRARTCLTRWEVPIRSPPWRGRKESAEE
ncbi:Glutamyl aminopeptidase, partial [Varanus komodoensis]